MVCQVVRIQPLQPLRVARATIEHVGGEGKKPQGWALVALGRTSAATRHMLGLFGLRITFWGARPIHKWSKRSCLVARLVQAYNSFWILLRTMIWHSLWHWINCFLATQHNAMFDMFFEIYPSSAQGRSSVMLVLKSRDGSFCLDHNHPHLDSMTIVSSLSSLLLCRTHKHPWRSNNLRKVSQRVS